ILQGLANRRCGLRRFPNALPGTTEVRARRLLKEDAMRDHRWSAGCLGFVTLVALLLSSAGMAQAADVDFSVRVEKPGGTATSTPSLEEVVIDGNNLARASASLSGLLGSLKVEVRTQKTAPGS